MYTSRLLHSFLHFFFHGNQNTGNQNTGLYSCNGGQTKLLVEKVFTHFCRELSVSVNIIENKSKFLMSVITYTLLAVFQFNVIKPTCPSVTAIRLKELVNYGKTDSDFTNTQIILLYDKNLYHASHIQAQSGFLFEITSYPLIDKYIILSRTIKPFPLPWAH